ncbi:MAG: polyprenyl synthetase family protein [Pseudomonadota bacterium]
MLSSVVSKKKEKTPSEKTIQDLMLRVEDIIVAESALSRVPLTQQIIKHIIHAGGKRIRPLLCVVSSSLFGPVREETCLAAAALEFIHTATLLHDDVVDDGEKRRGKSTANIVWGNKSAILTGDHLFARAFSLLVRTSHIPTLATVSHASEILAEGEILQLSLKNQIPSRQDYFDIINAKTASLFSAACEAGALLAGATPEYVQILKAFGQDFGLIFQIIDDILDYESHFDAMGKDLGHDFFEGKYTLPLILAFEQADDQEKKHIKEIMAPNALRDYDDFCGILRLIEKYETIAAARDFAQKLSEANKQRLCDLPQAPSLALLKDLSAKALHRMS